MRSFHLKQDPDRPEKLAHGIVITIEIMALCLLLFTILKDYTPLGDVLPAALSGNTASPSDAKKHIKWVDFDVSSEAMTDAFRYDVDTFQSEIPLKWVDMLSFLGASYGGDFSKYNKKDLDALAQKLSNGETMESLTSKMKYYSYYREAYGAVLDGLVGKYEIQIPAVNAPSFALPSVLEDGSPDPDRVWVTQYGLKAFSPIAKNFPYQDFDDFGTARSYGYKRQHLGHDMMGQVGTPVIAVESGYVEAIGWNQYGGWRLGIRSFDGKRYYYYAHLRKNYPYHKSLEQGSIVKAGDVIGYLGRTGYSAAENTNNIDTAHLHFGLQLIFDESQKDGTNQIWVNCYELIKFLTVNRSETIKNQETKEYSRVYQFKDPSIPENFEAPASPQPKDESGHGEEEKK